MLHHVVGNRSLEFAIEYTNIFIQKETFQKTEAPIVAYRTSIMLV